MYFTTVVPAGKTAPGECDFVTVTPRQLSIAVGSVQLTDASQEFFALTAMFDGQLAKSGGVLSSTITLNEQVEVFPPLSKAV